MHHLRGGRSLVGHVRDSAPPRPSPFTTVPTEADASRLPRLVATGERWPVLAARDTFPRALEAIVDGLLAQATATP
ncbi:hypothetical protein GCM10010472_37320 [Pseudonocardia halophobica]|uniref:Uncharacterized protein n=1 Tax=Pseudonocardia halophobica TaxID=29401 RepID=A0A9W6L6M5_9PSEU|nr:hypothetical protein GCM10017577_52040 [Pseudonocardia halophobica]